MACLVAHGGTRPVAAVVAAALPEVLHGRARVSREVTRRIDRLDEQMHGSVVAAAHYNFSILKQYNIFK